MKRIDHSKLNQTPAPAAQAEQGPLGTQGAQPLPGAHAMQGGHTAHHSGQGHPLLKDAAPQFDQRIHARDCDGLSVVKAGVIEFLGTATLIILYGCIGINPHAQTFAELFLPTAVTYGILIIGAGPIS